MRQGNEHISRVSGSVEVTEKSVSPNHFLKAGLSLNCLNNLVWSARSSTNTGYSALSCSMQAFCVSDCFMMEERPIALNIRNFSYDLHADAARIAYRNHTTIRDVVIAAVREYVDKRLDRDVTRHIDKSAS
jgi:hypothetical protein